MSASFEISCSTGSYRVEIRSGLLADVLARSRNAVVLCDERFSSMLAEANLSFVPVRANETVKSLDAIPEFVTQMRRLGATRQTPLVAIGGGIVQDVAAFCASVFMRGLSWSYLPTTLLGMADSCIGGKSSINVGEYKNLVGTFHPPAAVLIDPAFARTLSKAQMVEGLCEAVKICFCRGPEAFDEYLRANPVTDMAESSLEKVIGISLASKRWFIEQDEFDRGPRLLLNFGHTFGHAIEGATHFGVSHGVAVGLGVLCAIAFGESTGREYGKHLPIQTLKTHIEGLLEDVPDLPQQLRGTTAAQCFERFLADKKHESDQFTLILITQVGTMERCKLAKGADSEARIVAVFDRMLKKYQA